MPGGARSPSLSSNQLSGSHTSLEQNSDYVFLQASFFLTNFLFSRYANGEDFLNTLYKIFDNICFPDILGHAYTFI